MFFLTALLVLPELPAQSEELHWVDVGAPQLNENALLWIDTATQIGLGQQYEKAVLFLEQQIQDGLISAADHTTITLLKRIALAQHSRTEGPSYGPLPRHRQLAILLLGKLGGNYSLAAVDEILNSETDPFLLTNIFLVYRDIAPPFNTMRSQQFTKHLNRANLIEYNDRLILSILAAIDSMHRETWSMNSEPLFAAIMTVSNTSKRYGTRAAALGLAQFITGIE